MSDLEGRLEALFAADARASRLQAVRMPPRRSRWLAGVAFVAATAVVTMAAVLVLDNPRRSDSGQAAAPPAAVAPSPGTGAFSAAVVSADGKSVVDGRQQVVLVVDDDQIVEWFRTQSQLCDAPNIGSRPDRRAFCTDKAAFKGKTRFASVVSSPDVVEVGFTITSDALAPDSVAGIFLRSTGKVQFLTDYYLGSQFISFSPTGGSFVYQGACVEGNCALFVRDSATLAETARVNAGTDKHENASFVRWLSDRQFEYKLGTELKTASF